jgi:hypothetical protein
MGIRQVENESLYYDDFHRIDRLAATPHGYYGIENQVVCLIGSWMQNHLQ